MKLDTPTLRRPGILLGILFIAVALSACGDSTEPAPMTDSTGSTPAAGSTEPTPMTKDEPGTWDKYTAWCSEASLQELSDEETNREVSAFYADVMETMRSTAPPAEGADWHNKNVALLGALKDRIDADPPDEFFDPFAVFADSDVESLFREAEEAFNDIPVNVRWQLFTAGCWENPGEVSTAGERVTTEFTSISAGWEAHTCGIGTDGYVGCWGSNLNGEATPPDGEFISVSAGGYQTCGVWTDGTAVCWGFSRFTPPGGEFMLVSAGVLHACGVRTDGTVACWGDDYHGRAFSPDGEFVSVSAGRDHNCGVQADGAVACWGGGDDAEESMPPGGEFTSVSAGVDYTCGVQADGAIACWGDDDVGQASPPNGEFISVSTGWDHACGVRTDGTVACWGGGNDAEESMPPGGGFTSVSAGLDFTCGARTDGSAVCWGSDGEGQASPPVAP